MPDVLLFGATGFTGRLTARAMARRGMSFAIAGRSRDKLEKLAAEVGNPEIRVATAGDTGSLVAALEDVKVMITCVGPFVDLGWTAVDAALESGTHYLDSTGEGTFIGRLIAERSAPARDAGIAMVPAMGFDEVPADVAGSLATDGMKRPNLVLTYAAPQSASVGTIRSALGILASKGPWVEEGRRIWIRAGERTRWAPMPPPLGPRVGVAFPLASGHVLPLHLDLETLEVYVTVGAAQRPLMRYGLPLFAPLLRSGVAEPVIEAFLRRLPEGPEGDRRYKPWTILAEAWEGKTWRNVTLVGKDVYGLTAEFLALGASVLCEPGYDQTGVLSPVQAVGLETLQKELIDDEISVNVYESS